MKKVISTITIILMLTNIAFASQKLTVRVNGNNIDLQGADAYIDKANRTLVPIKFIADYLQAETKWDNVSKTATVTKNGKVVVICIPCKKITIDNQEVGADSYGALTKNRAYVPLAIIAKAFDVKVAFDNNTKTIDIYTDGTTPKPQIKKGENIDTSKMSISNLEYKGEPRDKAKKYLDATGLNLNIRLYAADDGGFGISYDHRNAYATYVILDDGTWLGWNSSTPESATYLGNYIGRTIEKIIFANNNEEWVNLVVPTNIKIEHKIAQHLLNK